MQTMRSAPFAAIHGDSTGKHYRPRRAEETIVHQVVREHLGTFLERAREHDRPVPRFVEREMRDFLVYWSSDFCTSRHPSDLSVSQ